MAEIDPILQSSFDRRSAAWSAWGRLDGDVLTHLVNPSLTGGPRWPALRQAFRVARHGESILVASDGLSDPFDEEEEEDDEVEIGEEDEDEEDEDDDDDDEDEDDEEYDEDEEDQEDDDAVNGFGVEFFAISAEPLGEIPGSWLFDLVWQMSQFAAKRGDVAEMVEELGLLTTELYGVKIPEAMRARFVNNSGRVGVMIGLPDEQIPAAVEGPLSSIRLLSLKLLTLEELAYCVEHGSRGREELARRFEAHPPAAASSLSRASVL